MNIKQSKGFTLIEILVVIFIIAILAGMLLPILWSMKKEGLSAKCKNNLRQFGAGFEMYKTNNNELLPPQLIALYPSYADDPGIFLCPADISKGAEGGKPEIVDDEDWEHETDEPGSSYFYEFSGVECSWDYNGHLNATDEEITGDPAATGATWNQVKMYQLLHGDDYRDEPYPPDRFPVVRCFWHAVNPDENKQKVILNLSFSGRVFESGPKWEETAN